MSVTEQMVFLSMFNLSLFLFGDINTAGITLVIDFLVQPSVTLSRQETGVITTQNVLETVWMW